MPRNSRISIPGGIHHVITRGIERKRIFFTDGERQNFLTRLIRGLENTDCRCYGWVLMPNHIHLLIKTGVRTLSDLMRSVLTGYAVYFNKKHNRTGHLFQNRFKSILCQEDSYLKKLVAYIHLNPYRARIVKSLEELEKYRWCGHGILTGYRRGPWQEVHDVLSFFGTTTKESRKNYKAFVRDNLTKDLGNELMGGGLIRSVGGWDGIERLKQRKKRLRGDERILGEDPFVNEVLKNYEEQLEQREKLRMQGWTVDKVACHICDLFNLNSSDILRKGRNNITSEVRSLICYCGYHDIGLKGVDLAKFFNISGAAVTKNIRLGEDIAKNRSIKLIS